MLCHPEPHPAVNYALRNAKSLLTEQLGGVQKKSSRTALGADYWLEIGAHSRVFLSAHD